MTLRRSVHLLLEHPFVGRADRVLGAPEHLGAGALGLPECELGHRAADAALDSLGAEGDLVLSFALAPLLRAVGIADRHAHDGDRRVHVTDGHDSGDTAPGPHDHLAADLLPQDPVRRADVVPAFGRDRGALQAKPVLANRDSRLVDDAVLRRPAVFQREVEARKLQLDADHLRREHAQAFFQELLAGLVALEDDDRVLVPHRRAV